MRRCILPGLLLTVLLPAQQPATGKTEAKDTKAQPKQAKTDPAKPEAAKPEPAKPSPPPEPRERRQADYTYDINGRPVTRGPASTEQRRGQGSSAVVERQETLRDASGRPVTTRSEQEKVLSESAGSRTSERVIQRYDLNGKPTSKQVVRTEQRKMADGTVVTTEVLYEQDLSGRLQFTERRITTDKKTDAGGATTMVVERPGLSGGTQVVERTDRVETKRSDKVTEAVSSRKLLDNNGRLEERERESSVITKAGDVTTKESKQWERGITGNLDYVGRSSSRITEKPDGSQVEDAEVYTTRISGTTPDLNLPQVPTLEQKSRRERKVQPDGKIVETTSTQLRKVAEPTRLTGLMVEEQVITPTADGKKIQKTLSERDANGRMVRTQSVVEEEKK